MKTSSILASALFGALAIAAPVDKRALVTKTELKIETVIVYTTVWDGQAPEVPEATPTAVAEFHQQQQQKPASSQAEQTPSPVDTPAYTPPAQEPSSVYTPPANTPSPEPTPAPQPSSAPAPAPEPSTPAYTPSPAAPAPAPAQSSSAPSGGSSPSGKVYSGDMTIHEYGTGGSLGACGTEITEDMLKVAVSSTVSGPNTWDAQTGDSNNPFCNKKIVIEHDGKTVDAVIADMCMGGCGDAGLDVSKAVWDQLTGGIAPTRLSLKWWAAE